MEGPSPIRSPEESVASPEQRALELGYQCSTCLGPNVRRLQSDYFRTCSPRCSRLWARARYHLDDRYRARLMVATAKWALNNPGRASSAQVQGAKSTLSGERRARGRWTVPGSGVDRALEEVVRLRQQTLRRNPQRRPLRDRPPL